MIQDNTTIPIECSCGRRLSVPKKLGGKRIKCVRCNRTIGVPAEPKPAARKPATKAPPLPVPTNDELEADEEEERNPAKTLAGVLAGLVIALLLLLLLFWFWPRDQQIATTPDGQQRSAPKAGGEGTDLDSQETTSAEKESELENSSDAPELDVEEAEKPVEDPAVVEEEEVGASEEQTETDDPERTTGTAPANAEEETELSRAPAQGGTRKTISGLTQSTMAGVKVYGSIALVCDISGSMQSDLPSLIKELRSNFPADTPLIFVHGCSFLPPSNSKPTKGLSGYSFALMSLMHDQHVYSCRSTTDAIIFAAQDLKRDTVMFNNDLQDSSSERAIHALEKLHKEIPFRLSGRSLQRDAPACLLNFIKMTGGDFVVDPINRVKQPALPWRR